MISKIKFKNIIILSVFAVYFISSFFMFYIFIQFYNESLKQKVYSENLFSSKVASDFITKEREGVANDARRIAGNKVLFIALRNSFYLNINKYTADKEVIKKLPLNVLNYKKMVNEIEVETFGYHGDKIKRYFEIFDKDFKLVGHTGKKYTEDPAQKKYYTVLYDNFSAATSIGLDVCDYEEDNIVLKGIYLISFYEEKYGFSVVKEYIDTSFLDSIKKLTNRDIILVKDNTILNSTIYSNENIVKNIPISLGKNESSKVINLNGKELYFDFIPIVDYSKTTIAYVGIGFDMNMLNEIYKKSIIKFWQYETIFSILLLIFLILMLNSLFKPFLKLSARLENIAEGEYKYDLPLKTIPELKPFVKSIENLSEKVETRELSLQALNQELEQKVEERTAELQLKNKELENNIRRLKEAQLQLILSEKMASIGKLAAGIAHEINSPLGAIYTTSQLMKSELSSVENNDSRESFAEYIDIIEEGARKSRNIISRLFKTTPDSVSYFKIIDLKELINNIIADFSSDSSQLITYEVSLEDDLKISGNIVDLKKSLIAIISNAKDAIISSSKSGLIKIIGQKEDSWVKIIIEDNGTGIDADILSKVFDPFFTTKDVGKGVGLGMTEVYEIIKKHNGTINIDSKKNEWTKIIITIDYCSQN